MVVIKFFSPWCSDDQILKDIKKFFDWNSDERYEKDYFFTSSNNFTHAILLNTYKPVKIQKEKIIGLAWEPLEHLKLTKNIIECYDKTIKKYYIGNIKISDKISDIFIESYSYMLPLIPYRDVNNFIKDYPKKNKLINYVYSQKNLSQYMLYSYRNDLGNCILDNDLNIDIYGGSTDNLRIKFKNKKNIKYSFDWNNVSEIYKDYKFSIVIENSRHPNYFSEKIIIPLLCGCIPLYLGCTKIKDYFGDYVINLTGELPKDMDIIKQVIKNPDNFYKKVDINKIKELVHMKNLIHKEFF